MTQPKRVLRKQALNRAVSSEIFRIFKQLSASVRFLTNG